MDTFNNEFQARLSFVITFSCSLVCSSKASMDSRLISPVSLFSGRVRPRDTLDVFAYIDCDGCLGSCRPSLSLLVTGANGGIASWVLVESLM